MTFVAVNHVNEPVREFNTRRAAELYVEAADAFKGVGWTVEERDDE